MDLNTCAISHQNHPIILIFCSTDGLIDPYNLIIN